MPAPLQERIVAFSWGWRASLVWKREMRRRPAMDEVLRHFIFWTAHILLPEDDIKKTKR